ncbi:shikimate kinase [Hymenobacter sp. BT683]|uniref:Shikimate kinase n=1 Tax=Hymenobacter jeongseonensis TaxID=2791027 RepID=A0ABS0IJC0_9BACT|nr:shikimate kinase [Hymenobacter jeongseonensis]MBF9238436.1 shikimate kinase [Hymenobacter jeongseonensis]
MKLFLIGMPGSGKTTLGRELAAHFGVPFLDLDAEIVARAGQVISAIFLQHGEAHFRQLEADTLRDISAQPGPMVLATGGGTPCFHDNLTVLNATGVTLWLDVPVPVLTARLAVAAEKKSRPLLATSGPTEKWLRETLSTRTQFYQQAQLRCAADACNTEAVAAQLAAAGIAVS